MKASQSLKSETVVTSGMKNALSSQEQNHKDTSEDRKRIFKEEES